MAENSKIGWTQHTLNVSIGCTKVSPGCGKCYAEAWAKRAGRDFDTVTLRPKALKDLERIKEPALIFVNSLSDLFHRDIPLDYLERVWFAIVEREDLIFQVLTKRPHRMAHILRREGWPVMPHIWLGTSVESQTFADNRIPALLSIEAPIRWLSCEPLLGQVTLRDYLSTNGIHWVVTGGESGPGFTKANLDWFRLIRDECLESGTAYFHKQGSSLYPGRDRELDGRTWEDYPPLHHPALIAR